MTIFSSAKIFSLLNPLISFDFVFLFENTQKKPIDNHNILWFNRFIAQDIIHPIEIGGWMHGF